MKKNVKMKVICAIGAVLLSGGVFVTAHNVINESEVISEKEKSDNEETIYYTEEDIMASAFDVEEEKRIYGYPTASHEYEVEDETQN